ncbi:hypothetical protein CRG98_001029 [Punica granatum]|uniref:Uncharacterized protein n=1 Tax=Punica granatum TaxID=22663 RepID=A0A2I0LD97_PUNGR|nr:hypothetical protein CRG98_001029 [Punica granatum]
MWRKKKENANNYLGQSPTSTIEEGTEELGLLFTVGPVGTDTQSRGRDYGGEARATRGPQQPIRRSKQAANLGITKAGTTALFIVRSPEHQKASRGDQTCNQSSPELLPTFSITKWDPPANQAKPSQPPSRKPWLLSMDG